MPLLTTQSAKSFGLGKILNLLDSDFYSIQSFNVSGSSTYTIDFNTIPNTYKHLRVVCSWLSQNATTGGAALNITFNNDTTSSYHYFQHNNNMSDNTINNNGAVTAATYFTNQSGYMGFTTADTTTSFAVGIFDIYEYANTSTKKSILWREGRIRDTDTHPTGRTGIVSGNYASTSAISSIQIKTLLPSSSNFYANSTFRLYGIGG